MARGDVHETGAGGVVDEVGREQSSGALAEGVFVLQRGQFFGLGGADDLIAFPTAFLAQGRQERIGHQVGVPLGEHVRVKELGVESHGQIGGQGPRGGRPDHHIGVGLAGQTQTHEHALTDVVGVLHLGLGQGGPEGHAPVHRLLAAVHEALLDHVGELTQLIGLVLRGQRQVRVGPIAQDAESLELLPLQIDVLAGIGVAGRPDGGRVGFGFALGAQLLGHFRLDGQTVAVPAGDVRGLESAQRLRLQDQILEDLVQGGADVDVAVGEGRAVVQHESGGLGPGGHQLPVEV